MSARTYWTITFVSLLTTVIGFALYFYLGCRYTGTEFSPDDFTIRRFSYKYDPMTNWVISGRKYEKGYTFAMPDLVADKYIKPVFKKKRNWHLVEDNGYYYYGYSADSDARLLVDFLQLYDENGENKWTVWNSDHPKLARVFWPFIAEMARDKTYLVVSDVLTFALDSDHSDPKKFDAALQQEVAKAYLKLGKIDLENNDLESAEYRVAKSMKYHSDDDTKSLLERIRKAKPLAEEPMPSSEKVSSE